MTTTLRRIMTIRRHEPARATGALVAAALALALTAGSAPSETAGDNAAAEVTSPSIVEVSGGELLGYTDNGVHTFRGVPYATAERFQRSEPVPAWEGVKPALTYGPT
jgi:para-nitrobenzyl esterase